MRSTIRVVVCLLVACVLAPVATSAEAGRKTETFPDNNEGFTKVTQRIESFHGRNLLARGDARIFASGIEARFLADGLAGERAGDGRVNVGGHPTVIACYLGKVKPIHEIGMFSFNGDARANQDFEVRLADNSANPGKMPKFPDAAAFTTGDTVVGAGSGGCHTSFAGADGSAVGKADWVEFRIWGTYGVAVGQAAHKDQGGWSAVVELEVLGDPKDAIVISPEEMARRRELDKRGSTTPYEKKATWWDTMLATREALVGWECELDGLVLERAGVTMGPWHTVGALPAGGPAASAVESLRKFDLTAQVSVKGGQPLQWRKVPELSDGKLADLAKAVGGKPGEVIYLARQMTLDAVYKGSESFGISMGMRGGHTWLSENLSRFESARGSAAPVAPNQWRWQLRDDPGTYHLLAALTVGADGKCELWFMPQPPMARPGAGNNETRISRRRDLFRQVERDFTDPLSKMQMFWEKQDSIWVRFDRRDMAGREFYFSDWAPGNPAFLAAQYNRFAAERAAAAVKEAGLLEPAIGAHAMPWLKQVLAASTAVPAAGAPADAAAGLPLAAARERYYSVATVQLAMAEHHRIESMRLAVIDQRDTFGDRYPKAAEYLQRIAALGKAMDETWPKVLAGGGAALGELLALRQRISAESGDILLDNPLLKFDKLLLGQGGPGFASNWGGANHIGGAIVTLSPVRPDGKIEAVYKGGGISDMDLSFDARKILFCDSSHVHEVNVDGTGHRQITNQTDQHVKHYDACRLPSGQIMFASTACEQAVPCTGEWYVGNLHVMDADGGNERRITFDQDHDWNPFVLNNGQVIYTRWEYTDIPHYFSRLLFTMNPDGSSQMEYYGSNSYWPNAMYWPRPIPGHDTRVVCVVSGHHGVSRVGQLVILDNAQGRQEADGVVQRIGERGRKVEPVIMDALVFEWWPKFAWPWPLADPATNRGAGSPTPLGAGKYFLVNCQPDEWSPWGVYLTDVFDNLTPLLIGNFAEPIPLVPRPTPPVIPPRVDVQRKDALVYMVDVTKGGGLNGYPAGAVKALRIGAHEYRFGGNGDTYSASYEGGWDIKRILGTVPVEADGSAYFRVPANTPIFVQPLDADGRALQTMRSWFTAMPGEVLSCVGCHERQSQTPPMGQSMASAKPPAEIAPWYGPTRGFSFDHEVQPVLDRRCAGCHDGGKGDTKPDFRARSLHVGYKGNYSPAYLALAKYVRRAGYEADYHLAAPSEWKADTSPVVQLLLKGHHNVKLSRQEWDRLYTWMDFNVPYSGNWRETHQPPADDQVARRAKYKQLYAGLNDVDEAVSAAPAVGKFEPPAPETADEGPGSPRMKLPGWPLSADQAAAAQKAAGLGDRVLDLGRGAAMPLVAIPAGRFVMGDPNGPPDERRQCVVAIDQPFYMAKFEVSNRQYSLFDPTHDSAYMDARGKDRYTRGYPVNDPNQPVIRISWHQAMAFCRWLSARSGLDCTLPTEAEWEYACRAGSASAWPFGDKLDGLSAVANIADSSLGGWAFGRVSPGYSDGAMFTVAPGRYKPNAWGLHDMIGNVAEWTRSDYRPYPYVETDGRNNPPNLTDPAPLGKVVRGGSWYSTFPHARSASRWAYPPHQPVFDVGLRVIARPLKVAQR